MLTALPASWLKQHVPFNGHCSRQAPSVAGSGSEVLSESPVMAQREPAVTRPTPVTDAVGQSHC